LFNIWFDQCDKTWSNIYYIIKSSLKKKIVFIFYVIE
jgi:hypothetical protein